MNTNNLNKFKDWLLSYGVEILPATNEFEELRFKGKHTGVLYTSGKTSNQYTIDAIHCFMKDKKWDGAPIKYGRNTSYKKEKRSLLERDGSKCFYCAGELEDDMTLEHLLALNNGGRNILGNMVLCHKRCNQEAGTLTIYEKVNLAIKKRMP